MSVERQFEDRLCKTLYKDKQSAATKRNISKLQSLCLKDKANTDEVNSGDSKCTDENIKKKDEKMERELWTPKLSVKKTTKRKSYLQQPTKLLHFKPNFESIQRVNSNRKAKQKTAQESKADCHTNRNSETDKNVSLKHSYIQTPEIIEKSKPTIFITENAGFSTYRHTLFCICRKTYNISKENWIFVMNMCIYIMNIHVVFVMNSIIIAALTLSYR